MARLVVMRLSSRLCPASALGFRVSLRCFGLWILDHRNCRACRVRGRQRAQEKTMHRYRRSLGSDVERKTRDGLEHSRAYRWRYTHVLCKQPHSLRETVLTDAMTCHHETGQAWG